VRLETERRIFTGIWVYAPTAGFFISESCKKCQTLFTSSCIWCQTPNTRHQMQLS
jgi:hypothetical protein